MRANIPLLSGRLLMTKNHNWVWPALNAIYFSMAAAALAWVAYAYFGASWTLAAVGILTVLYATASVVALLNLGTFDRLFRGSSAFTLAPNAQRVIRIAALLMPIPVFAFCVGFALCQNLDEGSMFQPKWEFSKIEMALFGKSVLLSAEPASGGQDVDYQPYMINLQRQMKQKWYPPNHRSASAIAAFKVHKNGRVSDLRLKLATGSETFDNACLAAVPQFAPPLPLGSPENVDIEFTFDYNYHE